MPSCPAKTHRCYPYAKKRRRRPNLHLRPHQLRRRNLLFTPASIPPNGVAVPCISNQRRPSIDFIIIEKPSTEVFDPCPVRRRAQPPLPSTTPCLLAPHRSSSSTQSDRFQSAIPAASSALPATDPITIDAVSLSQPRPSAFSRPLC